MTRENFLRVDLRYATHNKHTFMVMTAFLGCCGRVESIFSPREVRMRAENVKVVSRAPLLNSIYICLQFRKANHREWEKNVCRLLRNSSLAQTSLVSSILFFSSLLAAPNHRAHSKLSSNSNFCTEEATTDSMRS